jgi:hypothetical protein
MTIEQQVAELNENVGNLVSRSEILTDKIDDKLGEYEDKFQELQAWKDTIQKSSPITLEVGSGKEFAHPVDAANHINNSSLTGDNHWIIRIDPGVYEFPHNGVSGMAFSDHKIITITGTSGNVEDVIFRHINHDYFVWFILAERNTYVTVAHISFEEINPITNSLIDQFRNGSLKSGMEGAGRSGGIICRYNSNANIYNCNFTNLWHCIYCHDNCHMSVNHINGTRLYSGGYCHSSSRIHISKSSFEGIGGILDGNPSPWLGLGANSSSTLICYGINIKGFQIGIRSHWGSDVHFFKTTSYESDGVTLFDINGHIENCHHGIHCYYHSIVNVRNTLIQNIEDVAITAGKSSHIDAQSNVIVDGAHYGYFCGYNSFMDANDSSAENCQTAYRATNQSGIQALRTTVSNNEINYSPAISEVSDNYDSLILFS